MLTHVHYQHKYAFNHYFYIRRVSEHYKQKFVYVSVLQLTQNTLGIYMLN